MLRLKTKLASMLAVAMVVAVTAVSATPALAATQKYTCAFEGQSRTITQAQYERLVAEYGAVTVNTFCQPL